MNKKRFLFFFTILMILTLLPVMNNINKAYAESTPNSTSKNTNFIHSAGRNFSILLSSDGLVYGWGLWGDSKEVQLSKKIVNPTNICQDINLEENDQFVNVFSGEQHCFILSSYGRVFAMGSGINQQFGYTDYLFKSKPTDITSLFPLSGDEKITHIGCGADFNIALTSKKRVLSFGKYHDGNLGINSENNSIVYDITANFSLQENDEIIDIKCGATHSLALSKNGYVYVFGSNEQGQLGIEGNSIVTVPTRLEEITNNAIKIACGRYSSYVLTNQNQLYGFGSNSHGQLATCETVLTSSKKTKPYLMNASFALENDEYIKDINAGYYYAIIQTNLNNYYSFGQNNSGQLANYSSLSTSFPQKMEYKSLLLADDEIEGISCGEQHCIASTKHGHILAWGSNLTNQLGQEDVSSQTNYKIIDITYNFPPLIYIATNTSSIKYQKYVLDVSAYYLDNEKINETYYCISETTSIPLKSWIQFDNTIEIEDYEGIVYVHLKIDSKKGTYYHVSKMYFLDHIAPTIELFDANNKKINNNYLNSTIFAIANDNNDNVEIVYEHNGKQYTTNSNTFSFTNDGTYIVYALDEAHNSSATIEFTIDTILPTITKIDNNLIQSSSFNTREKEITIQANEALICYQLNNNESFTALNDNESSFKVKLKKGINTLTIFDLAGNQSLTYEIIYSPRFFQDTQLLLIVFGSICCVFITIIIVIYTIKNKKRLIK